MMKTKKVHETRYIVVIWHQAGGHNDNKFYSVWSDENENSYVFDSAAQATSSWKDSKIDNVHAGTIVKMTAQSRAWI